MLFHIIRQFQNHLKIKRFSDSLSLGIIALGKYGIWNTLWVKLHDWFND